MLERRGAMRVQKVRLRAPYAPCEARLRAPTARRGAQLAEIAQEQ